MKILIHWFLSSLAIMVAAYVLPGIHVSSFWAAVVAALVIGILNVLVKPVLIVLTLPINILTLGLFTFVINALLILLASSIVKGFEVESFGWAFLFAIVLSIINWFFSSMKE